MPNRAPGRSADGGSTASRHSQCIAKNDESSRVWQLMISNQCPLCSTALVPRHQAARQARAPMQKNRCITDRTEWTHPIQDPPSMACTLCGFHCSHLAQFHRHTTEEHRAPPAHLHLTLDSSDEDTRAAPTRRRADQPGKNQQESRWHDRTRWRQR